MSSITKNQTVSAWQFVKKNFELACFVIVLAVQAMVDVFRMVFQMLWDFLDEKTHQ